MGIRSFAPGRNGRIARSVACRKRERYFMLCARFDGNLRAVAADAGGTDVRRRRWNLSVKTGEKRNMAQHTLDASTRALV